MLTKDDVHEPSALVYRDKEKGFSIWIDGFWKYPFPHFSVYNDYGVQSHATKVASFHIKDPYIITRGEDWVEPWIMTESEMQYLCSVLRGPNCSNHHTVWEDIIDAWNHETMNENWLVYFMINHNLVHTSIGKRMDKIIEKFNANYVPLSQPMPRWEY